jgi:hypothetical protein
MIFDNDIYFQESLAYSQFFCWLCLSIDHKISIHNLSFLQMEDDLNFLQMENELNILASRRQHQYFGKWKTTSYLEKSS